MREITKAEWQNHFEELFLTKMRRVDFRYNSHAHKEQESQSEFKFDERKHQSVLSFKQTMGLHADSIKSRYTTAEFKL